MAQLNEGETFSLTNSKFIKTPVMAAFIDGRQGVIADIEKDSPDPRLVASARRYGFCSAAATPLDYKGERLGALVVYTEQPHIFDEEELGLLASIAAQSATIAGSADVYGRLLKSEERYRELYDTAADWMYTLDLDGVIIECNETMAQALGVPRAEMIGRHIYDYEAAQDQKRAKDALKGFLERSKPGMTFSSEREFVTADGQRLIVEIHARSMPDVTGSALQWRTVARDITEKKEAEQRIELLAAAVENTHESVIITDLEGYVISANRATAEMLGFDAPAELTGTHIGEIYADENPGPLKEEMLRQTLKSGWEGQLIYRRRDGDSFPAFLSSSAVVDREGKPIAMVGISRDISEEQRMTEEILRRNRELAILNTIATAAAKSLDLESILEMCVASVIETGGYDGGIIYLLDTAGRQLKPRASHGIPDEMLQLVESLRVGEGIAGNVARTGSPIFVHDDELNPYLIDQPARNKHWFASIGGIPLVSRDRLLGVLMVATLERHEFSGQERALLASAGRTISVAIDNAGLFRDVARAKQEWESTFDAMTNAVSIHEEDYTIVRANRALANLLGIPAQDLVGRKCYEVFHGLAGPIADCPHRKAVKQGKSYTLVTEEPYLGRTINVSADPIFDAEGNVLGSVHDVRDITEQEQLREQLNQSEKIRALGEMAGGVAHDFNNFLTVILGNSQLLLAQTDAEDSVRESLESIQRAANDASETVRRIQEFTRVRTTRSFTTVDLNEVIRHSVEVTRPRWQNEAEARGISIDIQTALGEIPLVNGNESELAEVIINVIFNSLDAMRDGGTISISTWAEGETVMASITDTGHGMDEDVRRRVFEPFFSTKGSLGTGLGLSVAYGIINRHGGDIIVESSEDQGTTFLLRLPQGAFADLQEAREQAEELEAEVSHARILVVDDAAMIRALLHDILEDMGHETVTAESGSEALRLFNEALAGGREKFDIVLTDLGMPGMSGWELVQQIKQVSPETPVALITGWGDQLDPERMEQSMVVEVLAKPFKVRDVRRLLAKALAGRG